MTDTLQSPLLTAPEPSPNTIGPITTPVPEPAANQPKRSQLFPQRDYHKLNGADEARQRLGLTAEEMADVPIITNRVKRALGSPRRAVEILSSDPSPDSLAFVRKWNSLSQRDQRYVRLEDVIIASGLTVRRFWEILAGALMEQSAIDSKILVLEHQPDVLKATIKAATKGKTITTFDADGNKTVIDEQPDVFAQRLFHSITGAMPTPKGQTINLIQQNSPAQPKTVNAEVERTPLQSMDSFLIEVSEIARSRALPAPRVPDIPVEMPSTVPDIEYLPLSLDE